MKVPQAFARFAGRSELKANHTMVRDAYETTGPAVEVEKDTSVVNQLDFQTWLPYAAKTYKISPHIESYVVVPTPICPAVLPNRNGIAFPLKELIRYQAPPMARMTYKAWAGCPLHREHQNEDPEQAYGVVLDAALTKITGYGNDEYWKVMGLAAIDKEKHPEVATRFLNGTLKTFSMGALADVFTCSVCGSTVYGKKEQYKNCSHVTNFEEINFRLINTPEGLKLAFLNAHYLSPIELSIVEDPAWTTALSEQILYQGVDHG